MSIIESVRYKRKRWAQKVEVVIYGDILFLINFSMDFLTLFIVAKILHRPVRTAPMILSAGLGAVYGVASAVLPGNVLFELLINLAMSLLMCYIVFDKRLLSCTALFYTVGLLLGGAVTAVFELINRFRGSRYVSVNGNVETLSGRVSPGWMAGIALVTGIAAIVSGRFARKRAKAPAVKIHVTDGERSLDLTGLCDSGNLLCEPIGGAPVIITGSVLLIDLVPEPLRPAFSEGGIARLDSIGLSLMRKVRIIPVSHAGGEGVMVGFMPEHAEINGIPRKVCIACRGGDAEAPDFGGYEAIVPSVLV